MERLKLAKKKKLNWRDLGLITVAAFAWSKLGVGETVKEIAGVGTIPLKPDGGCPAGWIKAGNRCIKL